MDLNTNIVGSYTLNATFPNTFGPVIGTGVISLDESPCISRHQSCLDQIAVLEAKVDEMGAVLDKYKSTLMYYQGLLEARDHFEEARKQMGGDQ